jgi:menaquinone-dependent protoporphyrinogen oxidase
MHALIAYASAHGSTRGIAERIAALLRERGIDATATPVTDVDDVSAYDAFVIGSAIHGQRWLPEATAFVERHAAALAPRPVWLFSVSSVGDEESFFGRRAAAMMRRARGDLPDVAKARSATNARGHRHFAGAIARDHYSWTGDLFMKASGGRYGDHRNWPAIDGWANEIAAELAPAGRPG